MKKAAFYLSALAAFFLAGGNLFAQVGVSTDKSDYPPGSTVQITGTGFQPGETVQLQVLNISDPSDYGPQDDPWDVTADTNGNFTTTWYVTDDELNMTLQLTATGLTSGLVAQTTFMDGSVSSVTVGSQLPSTITPGGTASNLVSVVVAGNTTATPTVSGLPTGASGSFTPTSKTGNGTTLTFLLIITTSGSTPPGTTSFTASAGGINGTGTLDVVPGPVDHFAISAISSPQTAGTAITGITLTAQDVNGNTCSSGPNVFTGTVTFGGTAGVTGASAAFTAGVLSGVSVTPTVAGSSLTFTVNDGSGHTGSATITTVNPGAISQLVMNPTTIASATAGTSVSGSFTSITAKDANGNTCSSGPNAFTSTVTFGGTAGATGTSANFTAGVLSTFPTLTPTTAGSSKTITATSGSVVGTTTITTVNPGAISQLVMNPTTIASATAGTSVNGSFTSITAKDANGNTCSSGPNAFTGTVTFGGTAGATGTSAAFSAGVLSTFPTLTPTTAGSSKTITATSGSVVGTTTITTVNPGAISQLVMNPTTIASATAGTSVSGSFTSITAKDANGNTCSSGPNAFTSTVTFGGTAGATGTSANFTAGVLSTFPTLTPTTAGSGKTITATSGSIVGTTTITTVNPGTFSQLVMNPVTIASATAGASVSGSFTSITAEDANGNVCSSGPNAFTGTVTFGGTAGATGTSAAFSAGVLSTFPTLTPTTAGSSKTITATSGSVVGTTTITTVNPGAISQLVMNPTTIASATAGASVSGSFTSITAKDANGNVCSSGPNAFTGTVSFAGTAGATGTSANFTAGVLSTFPTLTPAVAGSSKTITATSGSVVGTTTITTVNPGTFSQLVMNPTTIASATAGTSVNGSFTSITAKDANGNVCSSGPNAFTSTVTFGGTAGATGTSAAFSAGVLSTFPTLTPTTAGSSKTITATSGSVVGTTTITTVNPGTANKLVMKTEPSSSVRAGAAFGTEPAVYIEDQYNNVLTGDNSSVVTAAVQTGTGPLTGTLTATAAGGVATFSSLDAPTTVQSGLKLQFADTGDGLSALNDSTSITVNNSLPTLNAAHYTRVAGLSLKMKIGDLLTNAADVDGDTLALSYTSPSTNGTTLFDDGIYIYYTNSAPTNVNDAFSYSVNDGFGNSASNEVFITIDHTQTGQQSPQLTVSGSTVTVTFFGVPGYVYDVQRNTNLSAGAGWVNISTNTTPAGGVFTVTDTFPDISNPPPASAYYQLLAP